MKSPYIALVESVENAETIMEKPIEGSTSMKLKQQKPKVEQLQFARKKSKVHESRMIHHFEHPKPYRPHFRVGKRVCINCDIIKLYGNLVFCPQFGWEIAVPVAKTQQVCKDENCKRDLGEWEIMVE